MAPSAAETDERYSSKAAASQKPNKATLHNGTVYEFHSRDDGKVQSPPQIPQEPYGSRKRMRIAVIGAGISGLNIFKAAEEKLRNVELVCYEKNHDIGGT